MTVKIQDNLKDYDQNKHVLWQYEDALKFRALLEADAMLYNKSINKFIADYPKNYISIATANEMGLENWGRILGYDVFRYNETSLTPFDAFGFNQDADHTFDNSAFASSGGAIFISAEERRIALQLRYFFLSWNSCVNQANTFLNYLFKNYGDINMTDNLNMTATINVFFDVSKFNFVFNPVYRDEYWIAPTGVKYLFSNIVGEVFGFDGDATSRVKPFDIAPFIKTLGKQNG
jgi:hypothetical protein